MTKQANSKPGTINSQEEFHPPPASSTDDPKLKITPDQYKAKHPKRRFSIKEIFATLAAIISVVIGTVQIIQFIKSDQKPEVIIASDVEVASGVRLNRNAVTGEKITAEMVSVGPDDGGAFKIAEDVFGDCISDNLPKGSRLTLENVGPCP
jgi:hypothetical protein